MGVWSRWSLGALVLVSASVSAARAQPGPDSATRPFEGLWVGRADDGDRVILEVEPTVMGPMEVRWMILPMGGGRMRAGRCTETTVEAPSASSSVRWTCRHGELPTATRVHLSDPTHLEVWWITRHARLERVAHDVYWSGTPSEAPAAEVDPAARDQRAVASWIADRVHRAGQGSEERVRVPLVQVAEGWGCPCPDHYIGHDPTQHDGEATWVAVEVEPGVALPPDRPRGQVLEVEGRFTGEVRERYEPHGYSYRVAVFRVTRVVRVMSRSARAGARARVLPPVDGA